MELDGLFKQFLESYHYYPELTNDGMRESMTEEERNAKIAEAKSKHGANFEKWKNLPSEIILAHPEGVPQWILDISNEADPARLLVLKENTNIRTRQELEEKVKQVEEENRRQQGYSEAQAKEAYAQERALFEKMVDIAIVVMVAQPIIEAGYGEQTAQDLAKERLFRDALFAQAGGIKLSEEHRAVLRQSRLKTFDLIKEEWEKRMPERALVHELSRFNRGKISAEKASAKIADLVQLIRNNDRYDELDRYLSRPLVKAKIRQFDMDNPEKAEILSALDRVLFEAQHRTPETAQKDKVSELLATKDLPYDVRTLLGRTQEAEKFNEPNTMLGRKPRVRFRMNTNQNTQS